MENVTICVCDGSIDGIFCAIYRAWHIGTSRTKVAVEYGDMELFAVYEDVTVDYEISAKVAKTIIEKISKEAYDYICRAALSSDRERGEAIYRFMIKGVKIGKRVVECLTDPYVSKVMKLQKTVWYEYHHYLGFLRFQEVNDVLVAKYEPKSNVLAMTAEYFSDRLGTLNWVIIDVPRKIAAFHAKNHPFVITNVTEEQIEALEGVKDEYGDLWKVFFDTITIKERENLQLQRNNMPLRYRKYMGQE